MAKKNVTAEKKVPEAQENTASQAPSTPAPSTPAKKEASQKKTLEKKTVAPASVHEIVSEKQLKKDKPKKVKMIRDSFTLPEHDYAKLSDLKKKCLQAGVQVKKSELIRAGLLGLSKLTDAALLKIVAQVEVIKTGRPAKE
jgi:hypothetical protein